MFRSGLLGRFGASGARQRSAHLLGMPLALAAAQVAAGQVAAGQLAVGAPLAVADLPTVIGNATKWLVGIAATVATFFLTLGGIRYMTAGDDPAAVEKAKTALKAAGIGYAFTLLAPVILTILKQILGVQ